MPPMHNINLDFPHRVVISMGTDLDAANRRLNQVIATLSSYANSPEVAKNVSAPIATTDQTMSWNPRAISRIPSIGGKFSVVRSKLILSPTDWGAEPLTANKGWEHTHKSTSPNLPDAIAESEDSTVFLLYSIWAESLTENVDREHTRRSITSYLQRHEILERFNEIAQREDNWDGLESAKPIKSSLVRAKRLIEKLLDDILSAGYSWRRFKPLISSDEDGYITIRWRVGGKRLQLRIEEDEVRYIKLWKEHNKRKMHTDRTRSDNCFEIWEWLINDE